MAEDEYRLTEETYAKILLRGMKFVAEGKVDRPSDGCDMAIDQMINELSGKYSTEELHQMRKAIRIAFNYDLANHRFGEKYGHV